MWKTYMWSLWQEKAGHTCKSFEEGDDIGESTYGNITQ